MKEPQRLRDIDPDAAVLLRAAADYQPPRGAHRRLVRFLALSLTAGASASSVSVAVAAKTWVMVCAVTTTVAGTGIVAYRARAPARQRAELARSRVARQAPPELPARLETPPPPAAATALAPSPLPPLPLTAPRAQTRIGSPLVALATPRPANPPSPPPVAPSEPLPMRAPLAGELVLLHAAETAIRRHDPGQALARVDEYARVFPDGALIDESSVLRVTALWNAGQLARARAEAALFLRTHSRSVLAPRVGALLSEIERQERTTAPRMEKP
ncbi:MAG: hypothetical protein QOI66_4264 [Myxococcales bacterium]|nr:hypothetical protein [Myxococcales bacterium]